MNAPVASEVGVAMVVPLKVTVTVCEGLKLAPVNVTVWPGATVDGEAVSVAAVWAVAGAARRIVTNATSIAAGPQITVVLRRIVAPP